MMNTVRFIAIMYDAYHELASVLEEFELVGSDYYRTKFNFYEIYQKIILRRLWQPVDRTRSVENEFHKATSMLF